MSPSFRSYETYSLQPTGMLSVHAFPIPRGNRKVHFVLPADQTPHLDIYIMIDRKLQNKVFINNSHMSTPVTFLESLWPQPHDCAAIVVNNSLFRLDDLSPPHL